MRRKGRPWRGRGIADRLRGVMVLRPRQHKSGRIVDIHTVFLKEYAVQVHSKACFEASFCHPLLHCRGLSTIDSPAQACDPPPPPWAGVSGSEVEIICSYASGALRWKWELFDVRHITYFFDYSFPGFIFMQIGYASRQSKYF